MKTGKGKWTGRWSPYRGIYDIRGTGGAGYNQVQLSQCHWQFGSGGQLLDRPLSLKVK